MFSQRLLFFCSYILTIFLQVISTQSFANEDLQKEPLLYDSSQHYRLYLPWNYIQGKEYPLLIFLDPGARGDFPVNKYKHVADELEIIIAGSFDSKNFDHQSSVNSIKAILNDISVKYQLDNERIWLSGFSGGARVASSYAVTDERIKGVIACGAGFAGEEFLTGKHTVSFVGIVGYKDMNFEELAGIGEQLTNKKKENLLLFFDGGHQWPPVQEMSIGVQCLLKEKRKEFTVSMTEKMLQTADSISNEGMHYLAWLQLKEYEKIPGLAEKISVVKNTIESQKKFKKDRNEFQTIMNEERQFMDEFSFLFSQTVFSEIKDAVNKSIWKEKISKLKLMRKNKSNYQQLSADRLFDFSWRLCIEQYNYLMSIKQFIPAYKAATILSLLEIKQINTEQLISRAKEGMSQ